MELARQLLYWLESHGRRVVNGLCAFELEMSKLRQDLALRRHGIRTPRTVLAVGKDHLLEAASTFGGPFITKHDQGERASASNSSRTRLSSEGTSMGRASTRGLVRG